MAGFSAYFTHHNEKRNKLAKHKGGMISKKVSKSVVCR
jgi:hypothetical protein